MATDSHQSSQAPERLDGPTPDPAAGVFETTLVVEGRPVALQSHLERLRASLGTLYGEGLPPEAGERVFEAAAGLELGRVRLTIVAGARLSVRAVPVDRALVLPPWERAVELAPVTVPGGIGAHKWADRRLLRLAEARCMPSTPLVVDADGTVLEASRGSLFMAVDGTLLTPPADGRLLPGITRAQLIAAARGLGIDVREDPIPIDGLAAADEVFLTGAIRGVEPVRRCRAVGEWSCGAITVRVAAEIRRLWLA